MILSQTRFNKPAGGWSLPLGDDTVEVSSKGMLVSPEKDATVRVNGSGVHTRNGDTIELTFRPMQSAQGSLHLGFAGGAESTVVILDFKTRRAQLRSSDWTRPQPEAKGTFPALSPRKVHTLVIEKSDGKGDLVKMARMRAILDGKEILHADDVNVLPEMGVFVYVAGVPIHLTRFVHRGPRIDVPEYLNLAGWQMLNRPSIEENLESIKTGLRKAADADVELLVTTETSLTGLFPSHRVTQDQRAVKKGEKALRKAIRDQREAPMWS
jgi:hypothetical protein